MRNQNIQLKEVDRVEILTLVDNYVDVLLESTDIVTRPPLATDDELPLDTFMAEHGLSLLVTVHEGQDTHTILFDTGYTKIGVPHNTGQLDVNVDEIEAIVLSHAHMDHTGSLHTLLESMAKPVTLVVHPDAFLFPRYIERDGRRLRIPRTLSRSDLERREVQILESRTPTLIADGTVIVTGGIERTTSFEKGLPNAHVERDGRMEPDTIPEDQSIVINLKGKGLVIISGCAHAGIINTIYYAQDMSGISNVYAVLGGFHLTGASFEPIIEQTIDELIMIAPEIIVPMHCTGWKAIQRFSEVFPSSFILNSVGSKITLS